MDAYPGGVSYAWIGVRGVGRRRNKCRRRDPPFSPCLRQGSQQRVVTASIRAKELVLDEEEGRESTYEVIGCLIRLHLK